MSGSLRWNAAPLVPALVVLQCIERLGGSIKYYLGRDCDCYGEVRTYTRAMDAREGEAAVM